MKFDFQKRNRIRYWFFVTVELIRIHNETNINNARQLNTHRDSFKLSRAIIRSVQLRRNCFKHTFSKSMHRSLKEITEPALSHELRLLEVYQLLLRTWIFRKIRANIVNTLALLSDFRRYEISGAQKKTAISISTHLSFDFEYQFRVSVA